LENPEKGQLSGGFDFRARDQKLTGREEASRLHTFTDLQEGISPLSTERGREQRVVRMFKIPVNSTTMRVEKNGSLAVPFVRKRIPHVREKA